jgi:chromosomal replication initiator protein
MSKMQELNGHTIAMQVATRAGLTFRDLIGVERRREVSWVRQDAYRAIREQTSLSLPQIARIFGRDHSTVLHGIRASKRRQEAAK